MSVEQYYDSYYKVLNDGFVSLKDSMGSDEDIEQAARVSYGKGTRKTSDTRNLLRYLMRHKHTTPFEMVELKFHVRVPMDCWRQWIRHRMSSTNEYSTRYSEAIDSQQKTNPKEWRLQSNNNKQGSSGFLEEWTKGHTSEDRKRIVGYDNLKEEYQNNPGLFLSEKEDDFHRTAIALYKERLELGIAKEQARKDLPLSTYTEAFWKIDLHNLFHFLKLRLDKHAQLEIRQYAHVLACLTKQVVPIAFEAFEDYNLYASNFTSLDKKLINCYFAGEYEFAKQKAYNIGMSYREFEEFESKLFNKERLDFDIEKLEKYIK